ncbi:MAG: hydroxymethylbilane synthase [Chloroflexi bacterium]|nr:hydroxymethylbilane synthase [Chloroflexota bacterium]
MRERIVIGSRGSKLAMVQAHSVADRLRKRHPHLEITIERVKTYGDRATHVSLERMGGIGVFVKELEEALLDGRIDLAVHSLKDVPTEMPEGLYLAAVPERLDPCDVLVARAGGLEDLPPGAVVGTGSLRRSVQLLRRRPDLVIASVRGNVDTRLRKVYDSELDAVVLAAAALVRLGWEDRISQYLCVDDFLPAVGQGALVIEARSDDAHMSEILATLNDLAAWQATAAERAFLKEVGGGCRAPIAALGAIEGDRLKLEGMVADAAGLKMLRDREEGDAGSPEEVGLRLAQKMLAMGAGELLAEVVGGER